MNDFFGQEGRVIEDDIVQREDLGNPLVIVSAGSTLDFVFDRDGQLVENWACTILVKKYPYEDAEVSRVVPLDEHQTWRGFLTQAETDSLTRRGIYRMIAVLTNSTTGEKEEIPARFQLNDPWS